MMDFENEARGLSQVGTGGAVQRRNEKGEITMEKVKVSRYVAGKRPEYAVDSSGESEEEDFQLKGSEDAVMNLMQSGNSSVSQSLASSKVPLPKTAAEAADARIKRLYQHLHNDDNTSQSRRRPQREVIDPEIIHESSSRNNSAVSVKQEAEHVSRFSDEPEPRRPSGRGREHEKMSPVSSENEDEPTEEEHHMRRMRMLQRAKARKAEDEELLAVEEEDEDRKGGGGYFGDDGNRASSDEEEASEYEDMSSSDDEGPSRLKPVFIAKHDRLSAKEKEKEKELTRAREFETRRVKEERRREALRIVEQIRKTEVEERKSNATESGDTTTQDLEAIATEDEDEEEAYEAWKLRELKRIKRDRDLKEKMERERDDIERIHEMTEEERKLFFRQNPLTVTNKMPKGKYKFMQKYYHRGAFYLDKEEDVLRRDITAPTLEDHFDKTVLPKAMQVKNFGRSGRTKYTHLVDQDTTEFSSPWNTESALAMKFQSKVGGGLKEVFERPSNSSSK